MIRTAFSIALVLFPMSAQALSCMRISLPEVYAQVDAAPEPYHLVLGKISLPKGFVPPGRDQDDLGIPYQVNGTFQGKIGTRQGFITSVRGPIEIDVTCVAHWCGGISQEEQIYFLAVTDAGYKLSATPCPRVGFSAIAENIEQAESCLAGRMCEPIQPR